MALRDLPGTIIALASFCECERSLQNTSQYCFGNKYFQTVRSIYWKKLTPCHQRFPTQSYFTQSMLMKYKSEWIIGKISSRMER